MIERTAEIRNAHGIHCRPSTVIVGEGSRYPGTIRVTAESGTSDLKTFLPLVALGLEEGTRVRIRVTGPDEAAMCNRLVELFETRFDFPPIADET